MRGDESDVTELTSVPSEFEAATIVEALRAQGIPAHHVGGTIAGFRAEVPSVVRVVVRRGDLERARAALRAIEAESIDVDWDEVDVGEPEEPARESLPDGSGYRCVRCGYRVEHVPPDRPCPECGHAAASASGAEIDPATDGAPARRRARARALMAQTALALAVFLASIVLALPAAVTLAAAAATLILAGWTGARMIWPATPTSVPARRR